MKMDHHSKKNIVGYGKLRYELNSLRKYVGRYRKLCVKAPMHRN